MGVRYLWEVLKPAGRTRALTEVALNDGFIKNTQCRGLRLGVDATAWFIESKATSQCGENPQLSVLFFRCARMLKLGLLPLFIFDGPKRPKLKRGKTVRTHIIDPLISSFRDIIDAYGFESRMAPGEAEAELGYLNREGIIDAVWTDDADALLFGAKKVLRTSTSLPDISNDETVVFSAEHIHNAIGLLSEDEIFFALLCGGDYDEQGLSGCGREVALGLTRASYGRSLMEAAQTLLLQDHAEEMAEFLVGWRSSIRHELKFNEHHYFKSRHMQLATNINDDFPNLQVLRNYTHPVTSARLKVALALPTWSKGPDISYLARLCERLFDWGTHGKIVERFRSVIYPGIATWALRVYAVHEPNRCHIQFGCSAFQDTCVTGLLSMTGRSRSNKLAEGIVEKELEVNTDILNPLATTALLNDRRQEMVPDFSLVGEEAPDEGSSHVQQVKKRPITACKVWLPSPMIVYAKNAAETDLNTKHFLGTIDLTGDAVDDIIDLTGEGLGEVGEGTFGVIELS